MTFRPFLKDLAQFHESPKWIEYSVTPKGNLLLWATALALISLTGQARLWWLVPLMVLTQLFPMYRMWIIGLGGSGLFLHHRLHLALHSPLWFVLDALIVVGTFYIFFLIAKFYSKLPAVTRRHPQLFLHLVMWVGMISFVFLPVNFRTDPAWMISANMASCFVVMVFIIWRIGYMLYSGKRGLVKNTRFVDHLVYGLSSMGGSQIPYGKGLDYLLSVLAKHRIDLAKSQLAGIKLLILANVWQWVNVLLDAVVFDSTSHFTSPIHLGLKHLDALITTHTESLPALGIVWASLMVDMVYEITTLAFKGHAIIGCLRLFGFNVFRNTYKPLTSTTLVVFWGRYFYYFKEVLVEFFFFPTYLSYFKTRPKLRVFTATMAAAFIGNFYFHILEHFGKFVRTGEVLYFANFYSYGFYCLILGLGISVSMLRQQLQRGKPTVAHSQNMDRLLTLRKIAGVWLFFAIVRIWDHSDAVFMQDTRFFFNLFGVAF